MTSDTDFRLFTKLQNEYAPAIRGIVSNAEKEKIRNVLELASRSDIELQNIRDMSVMLYAQKAAAVNDDPSPVMTHMDAMSAVTFVIDEEKSRRGLEV